MNKNEFKLVFHINLFKFWSKYFYEKEIQSMHIFFVLKMIESTLKI